MAETGTSLKAGKQVVTTAGTRVQLPTTAGNFAAKTVTIQALGTNEGEIVVGDSTVVAGPGTHAAPTQVGVSLAAKGSISIGIDDGGQIWLDATKSGDGVAWIALQA